MKAIKTKEGRVYTKGQVQEAISVWESRLRKLDENLDSEDGSAQDKLAETWSLLKRFVEDGGKKYVVHAESRDHSISNYLKVESIRLDGRKLIFDVEAENGRPVTYKFSEVVNDVDSLIAACEGCRAKDISSIELRLKQDKQPSGVFFKSEITGPGFPTNGVKDIFVIAFNVSAGSSFFDGI